jgi:hypothetical protein
MKLRLAGFLSERARLLLLSFAIAVAMWYYVDTTVRSAGEGQAVASLRLSNVEVTFAGLGDGWTAVAEPRGVDVEMRWPADAVLSVRAADVQAVADVSVLDPGRHRVNLRIQVPSGVTSVQATPASVIVSLARP